MILSHPDFHFSVNISENRFPVLVLERSDLFHCVISTIISQSEGDNGPFVLSENWEPLDISKSVIVLTNLFHVEINGRKQMAALNRALNTMALSEHHYQSTCALQNSILNWALDLENDLPCATIHNESIDISTLLKTAGIRFDDETSDITERLCNFIKICAEYLHAQLIVIANLHSHLEEQALNEIYKTAMYEKIPILNIERNLPDFKMSCEKYYIIDRDNCEIYNESDVDSL